MPQRKPFFQGMNKKATAAAVRVVVESVPFEQEFESELISNLISEKHYYCSRHGIRPMRFRKMGHAIWPYDLQGWFAERQKWHSVTWLRCVYPRRDQDWIARALRDAIAPELAAYKKARPICERCHAAASEEMHHVDPTFKKIVATALKRLDEHAWQAIVDHFDWWSDKPFTLPSNSPALAALQEVHAHAQLLA
ncbi:MAG TPA: hypothetical protein VIP11_19130, partial [Gemmatimonadaceae bacterium]